MEYAPGYGIIPAHAGNTLAFLFEDVYDGDHPRACGEHAAIVESAVKDKGSSPRMRGTHKIPWCITGQKGIIPAHAGNTEDNTNAA